MFSNLYIVLFIFRKYTAFAFSFLCCLGITIWVLPSTRCSKAENASIRNLPSPRYVDFRDGIIKYDSLGLETDADLVFQEVSEAWEYELIQGLAKNIRIIKYTNIMAEWNSSIF